MAINIKLVSFNIRHAKGTDGSVSLDRVADTLKNIKPDLVCLQEVDRFMPRSYLQDQAKWLSAAMGMNFAFAPNLRFNNRALFGNAILSRYPIADHGNTHLPGTGEQRGLQHCILTLQGNKKICLLNTHLGLSPQDRSAQVKEIVKRTSQTDLPLLLAGDFNSAPESEELQPLGSELRFICGPQINTFPAGNPRHQVDHIYSSHHWLITEVGSFPSNASDHLPLVCILTLL